MEVEESLQRIQAILQQLADQIDNLNPGLPVGWYEDIRDEIRRI